MGALDKARKALADLDLPAKAEKLVHDTEKVITELDLPAKAERLAHEAGKAAQATGHVAHEAVTKAGEAVHTNRASIDEAIGKVGDTVDSLTHGRSVQQVAKVKEQVSKGVDKLAEHRPGGSSDGAAAAPEDRDEPAPGGTDAEAPTGPADGSTEPPAADPGDGGDEHS